MHFPDTKNFLVKVFTFVPLLVPAYLLLILMADRFVPDDYALNLLDYPGNSDFLEVRMQEADSVNDLDILFVGSSRCHRGFDPRIFKKAGYESFNLGSSGQTALQSYALLSRYTDLMQPKLVVLEVFPSLFYQDGLYPGLQLVVNDEIDFHAVEMVFRSKNLSLFNSFLVESVYRFFGLDRKDVRKTKYQHKRKKSAYISGGFVQFKNGEFESFSEKKKKLFVGQELNQNQLKMFMASLSFLEAREIDFVLINAPTEKEFYTDYILNPEIDSIMNNSGSYINFNDEYNLSLTRDFFKNETHLNQKGVERFNLELIEKVIDPIFND